MEIRFVFRKGMSSQHPCLYSVLSRYQMLYTCRSAITINQEISNGDKTFSLVWFMLWWLHFEKAILDELCRSQVQGTDEQHKIQCGRDLRFLFCGDFLHVKTQILLLCLFRVFISLTTIWSDTLHLSVLIATYKKNYVGCWFFFLFHEVVHWSHWNYISATIIKIRTLCASWLHLIFSGFSTAAGLLTAFKIISIPLIFVYIHNIFLSTTSSSLCWKSHRSLILLLGQFS